MKTPSKTEYYADSGETWMEATDDIDKHNISRPDISAPKVIVNNVELDGTGNPQIFRQRMNM